MPQEQQIAIEERFARVFNDKSFKERLSSADFEKYINGKKRLSFQKHDTIFEDGETPKGVFVLEKGAAKLSKSGAFGKDQILRFIKEGDIIGYRSLLCGENFQAKAEAMTDIECVFTSRYLYVSSGSRSTTVFRNASENFLRIRRIFQYHYLPCPENGKRKAG
jgi:signal-transduction protein with cAMP-binding, CBS, and nucleotidyltransferase domain